MIGIFLSVVVILITILVIVLIHEIGHFVMAKKFKVAVDEFAVGFRPRLYSKKIGKTNFSLNLLPIGGYVQLRESPAHRDDKESFYNATPFGRIMISLGGPIANILLAWLIFAIILIIGIQAPNSPLNEKYIQDPHTLISYVAPDTPAYIAEIPTNVRVKEVSVENTIVDVNSLSQHITDNEKVSLTYIDENNLEKTILLNAENGRIGVGLQEVGTLKTSWAQAPFVAFNLIGTIFIEFWLTIWNLISPFSSTGMSEASLIGPIGIGEYILQIANSGIVPLIFFVGFLSLNIGLINLIPIPALDGWRVATSLFEWIANRRINERVEENLLKIGILFLIIIFVWVTAADIIRIL